ncbi:MAG TPA: squalene synthase HpnC, partial [Mycobacteriales bacterium]|nr:squalene synthase HpnC [Mycobacteriales bacterium]
MTGGPDWLDAEATLETIVDKSGLENFPVASRLLPARWRRHLLALYGFARLVDDVGDEAPGDRMALLDAIDTDLDRVVGAGTPHLSVLRTLEPTVRECRLPLDPFHRLVEANRRDQVVHRYQTYEQLADYCTLSANPVGHLVLGIFGAADPERVALSDRVCTALQLVEHWQDVAEDIGNDRIYLPAEDLRRFGVTEDDLRADHAGRAVRRLLAFQVARAQALLSTGAPLVGMLSGPARVAVAGFVAGGQAALDAIAR